MQLLTYHIKGKGASKQCKNSIIQNVKLLSSRFIKLIVYLKQRKGVLILRVLMMPLNACKLF